MASHLRSKLILGGNAMISASLRRFTQAPRRGVLSRRTFSASIPRRNDQKNIERPSRWIAWIGYRRDGTPRPAYATMIIVWSLVAVFGLVDISVKKYIKKAFRAWARPAAIEACFMLVKEVEAIDGEHYAATDFSDIDYALQYFDKLVTALHRVQKPLATGAFGCAALFDFEDDWWDVYGALTRRRDPEELERTLKAVVVACQKVHEKMSLEQAQRDVAVDGMDIMLPILNALTIIGRLHLPGDGYTSR